MLVEWEDSARPISAWQWIEDYDVPKIVSCLSVGYVIAETDDAIALAPNLGDIAQEKTQASDDPHSSTLNNQNLDVIALFYLATARLNMA